MVKQTGAKAPTATSKPVVGKKKPSTGSGSRPIIARPWSQMYDKRKRNRRIRSPNPNAPKEQSSMAESLKQLYRNLKKNKREPSSFQNRNQMVPFYGLGHQYGHLQSEDDPEETKVNSNFVEGDWFKPMRDIKMEIFGSNTSGVDSPNSFVNKSMRNLHSSVNSSVASKPLRPEFDHFRPLRDSGEFHTGLMSAKIMATSPMISGKKEPKLIISNPSVKIESVRIG